MTPKKDLQDTKKGKLAHWERGWRCHGYWINSERIGYVALSPPGFKVIYTWGLSETDKGKESSLKKAKLLVERAHKEAQI